MTDGDMNIHRSHRHHDTKHSAHDDMGHSMHRIKGINGMAASATLHCLTGCAIGEVTGLIIGTVLNWGALETITLSVTLAFVFGFTLSTLPLKKAGLGFFASLSIVFAADTLSIAAMELVDNTVMALIPGAMSAGIVNPMFWVAMPVSLAVAFVAAFPVNKYLLTKGKGHALVMKYHGHNH